jgi:hypothetical protein
MYMYNTVILQTHVSTLKHEGLEHIVTRQGTTIELNMRVNNFNRVRVLDTATSERKRVGTTKTSHMILKMATKHHIDIEVRNTNIEKQAGSSSR